MIRRSVMGQMLGYVRAERKWLLLPVFAILLLLGVLLAIAASSAVAPFIYTAF
jgi:hypothetical protein